MQVRMWYMDWCPRYHPTTWRCAGG